MSLSCLQHPRILSLGLAAQSHMQISSILRLSSPVRMENRLASVRQVLAPCRYINFSDRLRKREQEEQCHMCPLAAVSWRRITDILFESLKWSLKFCVIMISLKYQAKTLYFNSLSKMTSG